jgi:indolepyruvate ferredoxin oxidoreductase
VVSTTRTPTGKMIADRHVMFPATQGLTAGIDRVSRKDDNVFLDGQALAEGLFGDAMATNNFMVGVAFQAGTIPLKAESIEAAIKNSGVGVEQSLAAFRWGRMAVVDLAFVEAEVARSKGAGGHQPEAGAAAQCSGPGHRGVHRRPGRSEAPGGSARARADRLPGRGLCPALRRRAQARGGRRAGRALPGASALSEAAARYLYKLMAYKDEYEVARLHTDPAFLAELDAQFPHGYSVKYNLAPPLLADTDPQTGHLLKKQYGPWMFKAFQRLASWKKLRGGALDIFGKTEERSRSASSSMTTSGSLTTSSVG